jgi:hypothetical protein
VLPVAAIGGGLLLAGLAGVGFARRGTGSWTAGTA